MFKKRRSLYNIIGTSRRMTEVFRMIESVSVSDVTVIISLMIQYFCRFSKIFQQNCCFLGWDSLLYSRDLFRFNN